MSFSNSVPDANQSPVQFPGENQTNMTRLKTMFTADHKFNNSADPNSDGFHKAIRLINQSTTAPTGSAASTLYSKSVDGADELVFNDGSEKYISKTYTISEEGDIDAFLLTTKFQDIKTSSTTIGVQPNTIGKILILNTANGTGGNVGAEFFYEVDGTQIVNAWQKSQTNVNAAGNRTSNLLEVQLDGLAVQLRLIFGSSINNWTGKFKIFTL